MRLRGLFNYTVVVVGLLIIAMVSLLVGCVVLGSIPSDKKSTYLGSAIEISTYTDKLTYKPDIIYTRLGEWQAGFSLDLSDSIVLGIDSYDNYSYISYISTDESIYTGIAICEEIPEGLGVSDEAKQNLKLINNSFIECSIEDGQVIEKAYRNIHGIGYVIVIQQVDESSGKEAYTEQMLNTIYECMLFTKDVNLEKSMFVTFEGFGTFDLNELSVLNGKAGIYFGQDNVMRLYNYSEDKVYGFITHLNNEFMGNISSNLVQADGWNNLYYDKYKDDNTQMGYRGFGIQTSKGFYYFKVSEEAPVGFEDEIIEWLGIRPDDKKIDTLISQ